MQKHSKHYKHLKAKLGVKGDTKPGDLMKAFKTSGFKKAKKHEKKEEKHMKTMCKHCKSMSHSTEEHMKHEKKSDKHMKKEKHEKGMTPKGAHGRAAVHALGRTKKTGNFAKIEKAEGKGAAINAYQNALKAHQGKKKHMKKK